MISSLLVILQPDLESSTFARGMWHLHMLRRISSSEILITEIKKLLTRSKIDTPITSQTEIPLNISISSSILLAMLLASLFPHPNGISIWWLAREAICIGHSLWVQQALISSLVTYWARHWVNQSWCICFALASRNLPSYDYFLVETSLAVFAIFRGWYQVTPYVMQLLLVQVRLWLVSWWFDNCRNLHFGHAVLLISSPKQSATSSHPSGVNSCSFICFCQTLSMRSWTI